jgi:hypothetical protein
MDIAEALENLQGMGFCLAACERALRVSDNSLDRCDNYAHRIQQQGKTLLSVICRENIN